MPTRLIAPTKYPLATACAGCSSFQRYSRKPGDRRRRIKDDLGAVQPKTSRTLGKMPVVANVNADAGERRVETRIAEIARTEIKLFPKAGSHVRDVRLAVLAEILAVGVDDGRGVVINAGLLFLIDRERSAPCRAVLQRPASA